MNIFTRPARLNPRSRFHATYSSVDKILLTRIGLNRGMVSRNFSKVPHVGFVSPIRNLPVISVDDYVGLISFSSDVSFLFFSFAVFLYAIKFLFPISVSFLFTY